VAKSILAHVVAQTALERRVDFGLPRLERCGDVRGVGRSGHPVCPIQAGQHVNVLRLDGAGKQLQIADQQLLGELGCTSDQVGVAIEDKGLPVKDKLVLPPDERAERAGNVVFTHARTDHTELALGAFAGVIGGGRDVDDQACAGASEIGARFARDPDVLADRDADPVAAQLDQARPVAGGEIALLVEYAVVRQMDLAVDAGDRPVGEDRGGVIDEIAVFGEADDRHQVLRVPGEALDCRARVAQEVLLMQ